MVSPSRIRIARDYNRTLAAPVRWLHVLGAAVRAAVGDAWRWVRSPARRGWAFPASLAVLAVLVVPLDAAVSGWFEGHRPGGDVKRELEALQQFGQFAVSVVIAATIFVMDRRRARRLLDWAAGALVAMVAVTVMKGVTGRPRPGLHDAYHLTGPAGLYPVPAGGGYRMESPWLSGYDLASLPSRHACFAVLAAVFLAGMYPRLRPVVAGLAVIVMSARVVLGAHYLSDVLAGAALGYLIGHAASVGWWGVRAVDWGWRRLVDGYAEPAEARLRRLEGSGQAGGGEGG